MKCFVFLETKATFGEGDFLQHLIGLGSPHEWFGILVINIDVLIDSKDQIANASAQTIASNIAKEALHHAQPRCGGRRFRYGEPRIFSEPLLDLRMLVGGKKRCSIIFEVALSQIIICIRISQAGLMLQHTTVLS